MSDVSELPDRQPADQTPDQPGDDPSITIEMGGSNIVIRTSTPADRTSTTTIVEAINAATDADTPVVVDPAPTRCDDLFAAYAEEAVEPVCDEHEVCRPVAAKVVTAGIVRLQTERDAWLLDVSDGKLCRLDRHTDLRFIGADAWTPVVAVCITRSRLIAQLPDRRLFAARRAHRAAA